MPKPTDTTQSSRMKDAFDKARRATEAKDLHTAEQWQQVREIERRAEKLRDEAKRRFKVTRQEQQRTEVEKLLRDRYSPKRNLKPRGVADSNDLLRQADRNIRQRNDQRLARIDHAKERMVNEVRRFARERSLKFQKPTPGQDGFELKKSFSRARQ